MTTFRAPAVRTLRHLVLASILTASTLSGCSLQSASQSPQSTFPERSIHLTSIVPAGGAIDTIARALAGASTFTQPVIVDDLPGSGPPGVSQILQAAPDGYTVGITGVSVLMIPPLTTSGLPYKTPADYTPVMEVMTTTFVLAVGNDSPWRTIEDFLAYAKSHPHDIRTGVGGGLASLGNMEIAQLQQKSQVAITTVPFATNSAAVVAVLGKVINAAVVNPRDVLQFVQNKTMRVLGVFEQARNPVFPDVPTFKERNIDITLGSYIVLFTPKGTGQPVVQALYNGFRKAAQSDSFSTFLTTSGYRLELKDPIAIKQQMAADSKLFGQLVPTMNLVS
jgi:tripartite-type tricarboxylate transporter receptor subunit TctC